MFLYIIAILRLHNTIGLSKFNIRNVSIFKHVFQKFQGDIFPTQFLFASVIITIKHKNNWHGFYKAQKQELRNHLLRMIARLIKLFRYHNFLDTLAFQEIKVNKFV